MAKSDLPIIRPKDGNPARQSRWENEGGALLPPAAIAAAALRGLVGPIRPEQPRLYADLLAQADHQRDAVLTPGMFALRDPMP